MTKKYIIDIDGTICNTSGNDYSNSIPIKNRIQKINSLYDQGHYIKYMTARGATSKIDHNDLTVHQLNSWGCKYHELSAGEKEHYDFWIDDKAQNAKDFFND